MASVRKLAAAAAVAAVAAGAHCDVKQSARVICGDGSKEECHAKGCCWHPVMSRNSPWCFRPQEEVPTQCDVNQTDRVFCGDGSKDDCHARGCCWHPMAGRNTPWCYQPRVAAAEAKCSLAHASTGAPFSGEEMAKIRGYFMQNVDVQGSGAVVAAPDHNTGPGGDYYFHWERDGALSMSALMKTAKSLDDVKEHLERYVLWVEKVQNQPDPHGIDIRTEPKYTIPDGKPFSGDWCRPQTDGPGLRARTLAEYGTKLLEVGQDAFVRSHLWTGDAGKLNGGVVKYDLDWVASNWKQQGCDLWEEIRSDDFFWGRYTMRAAMHVGSRFASKMGDQESADRYQSVEEEITKTLAAHYDGNFVFESTNRKKDSAVIEAFNDGDIGDGLFAPLSKEVLGTVITLNELFCDAYAINKQDSTDKVPGILYGRYEGDTYDGGNPWVLLSASLAQLIYRQAADVLTKPVDEQTYGLLQKAYDVPSGLSGKALGDALLGSADGVMLRIKHHVAPLDLHMAEQIARDDGHMTSAKDLTWNYANVLKAMQARDIYVLSAAALEQIVL